MEFTILFTGIFLLLSALFSASETALFSIGREQIPLLAKGDKRSLAVYELLTRGEDTLIVILLGNLFVNLSIVSGVNKIISAIPGTTLLITFLSSTTILLLFGEILPKNIAISYATPISRFSAPILLGLLKALTPLVKIMSAMNQALLKVNYHYLLHSPAPFITSEEYNTALDLAVHKDELTLSAAQFLSSLLNFCDIPLQAIATHRSKLLFFSSETPKEEIIAKLPRGKIAILEKNNSVEIEALFFEGVEYRALWFPVSKSSGDLLEFMKSNSVPVVLLTDEYGSLYGIVTLEALLRYWRGAGKLSHKKLRACTITVGGDEALLHYKGWFPQCMLEKAGDVKTVNGVVTMWLEGIPERGDTFEVESCIFRIVEAQKNRIVEILIERSDEK